MPPASNVTARKSPRANCASITWKASSKAAKTAKWWNPARARKACSVLNIAHLGDEDDFMPPPKNKLGPKKLTDEQIGLVRAWIDQGAK